MAIDKQTRKDITKILEAHAIQGGLPEETDNFLCVGVNELGAYATKNFPLDEATSYYRNLAEVCSALSTFCKDRKLNIMYNPKESQFIIWK